MFELYVHKVFLNYMFIRCFWTMCSSVSSYFWHYYVSRYESVWEYFICIFPMLLFWRALESSFLLWSDRTSFMNQCFHFRCRIGCGCGLYTSRYSDHSLGISQCFNCRIGWVWGLYTSRYSNHSLGISQRFHCRIGWVWGYIPPDIQTTT